MVVLALYIYIVLFTLQVQLSHYFHIYIGLNNDPGINYVLQIYILLS